MNEAILEFIRKERVAVLALEMPDGSPHGATVHFAHSEDPLVFFMETRREYRKSAALLGGKSARASMVIGFSESKMKSFQLDGEVRLITDDEKEKFEKIYFGKYPDKRAKSGPGVLSFCFTPTWWRFTDWRTPAGKLILSSE